MGVFMALKDTSPSIFSLSDRYGPSEPYNKKEAEKRICPHCRHALGPGEVHNNNNSKKFTYSSGAYCMSIHLH